MSAVPGAPIAEVSWPLGASTSGRGVTWSSAACSGSRMLWVVNVKLIATSSRAMPWAAATASWA